MKRKALLFLAILISGTYSLLAQNRIPFEYDENVKKAIIIEAKVNDTIPVKLFFDTGVYGFLVLEDLNIYDKTENPKNVKIGNWEKIYYDFPKGRLDFLPKNYPLTSHLGVKGIIGWDFFEGKIIQVSFKEKFIQELDNTENLQGYDQFPIEKAKNLWGMPVSVYMQEKEINEKCLIDFGNTNTLTLDNDLIEKYTINTDSFQEGTTTTAIRGGEKRYILNADSIKAGTIKVAGERIAFGLNTRNRPFKGQLGNRFFENTEVILDFVNGYIYLKKNDR